LLHPGFLVAREALALMLVLQGVRGLVQPEAARRRRLVEQVEVLRDVARLHRREAVEVVLRQLAHLFHSTCR
jgi:uncharacterized protein YjeT (DUF2065 family)